MKCKHCKNKLELNKNPKIKSKYEFRMIKGKRVCKKCFTQLKGGKQNRGEVREIYLKYLQTPILH